MPNSVTGRSRALSSALSVASFPGIPMWLGTQHKIMVFWWFSVNSLCIYLKNSISNEFQKSQPCIACNADSESERMMNLSFVDLKTCSRCSSKAFDSADNTVVPSKSQHE